MSQNEWNMRDDDAKPSGETYRSTRAFIRGGSIEIAPPNVTYNREGARVADPTHGGTYNYGRPLGAPKRSALNVVAPWLDDSPAAEYEHAEKVTRDMAQIANRATSAAWRLEMALRNVRLATNAKEQEHALKELRATLDVVDRETETGYRTDTVKLYRYGRIGTMRSK